MKKRFYKSAAVAASVLMAASSMSMGAIPTFAASAAAVAGASGEQTDINGLVGTITAKGITESGVTVKAYQVVDGYYKDGSLVKYVLMDPVNGKIAAIGDETKGQTEGQNDIITADEITTIANNIGSGAFTADAGVTMTKGADGNYTADVEPGMYVILVSGANSTVYNPAIVAVNLDDANDVSKQNIKAGTVDLGKFFETSDGTTTTAAYLKSSTSTIDKTIKESTKAFKVAAEDTTGVSLSAKSEKGDTVAFGDTVTFTLDDMTIPSFSKDYESPKYIITDTLQEGSFSNLTTDSFTSIKIDNEDATIKNGVLMVGDTEVADVTVNDNSFEFSFKEAYLRSVAGNETRPTVVIEYQTVLLDTAGINFAENMNTVQLKYSNNPTDTTSYKTITKHTYHYTFGIDADIDGAKSEETHEYNKVTSSLATQEGKEATDYATTGTATGDSAGYAGENTKVSKAALAGAKFGIYSDEACTQAVAVKTINADGTMSSTGNPYQVVSDANGHFSFTGLDEGTYYVKEVDAPQGYSLSDAVYKTVISANLNEDGTLASYNVDTTYKSVSAGVSTWTAAGSAKYEAKATVGEDGSVTNDITSAVTPTEIVDTKLQTLVSTGGQGVMTIMFTALAVGVGASLMVVVAKKKERRA